MNTRQTEIIRLVSENGRLAVTQLAEQLNTSEVTIRKDLKLLSDKGILNREQGYACLQDKNSLSYHMAFHYEQKKRIAEAAAALVEDGETILVESGSCCALFAEELARCEKQVRIITNSTYLASFMANQSTVTLTLLGGDYQKSSQAMIGPLTKLCAKQYSVDKIFVGTDGYSEDLGFTGDDLTRADTVRAMTQSASHVYVLTESDKFIHPGTVSFLMPEEVTGLITDGKLSSEIQKSLIQRGMAIIIAS